MTISRHVRSSSSFCGNPSQGAEFDAVGHLVEPDVDVYVTYTVKGCDNGPPGFGVDTWSVDIPLVPQRRLRDGRYHEAVRSIV